ncbi:MAG: HlyD family efflux transporter periplasmic adaptor subunit [Pseudomonadales bacterium]
MNVAGKRLVLWGSVLAALALALVLAFRPQPVLVDIYPVRQQAMTVTVDAEGITRVRDIFTVSAPVGGRLLRTPLEVGDEVFEGETVVATIEPSDSAFLDPRAQAESQQDLEAAEASRDLARADLQRVEAELEFAASEVSRARDLFARGTVAQRFVDEAERSYKTAQAAVAAAEASLDAREHQVARARARLITPIGSASGGDGAPVVPAECNCFTMRAPVSGRVLRVFEESETVVVPGAPLLELGDPRDLEVVADFLSEDVVQISPGQSAMIDDWGGPEALEAVVRRVEPFGFTKISALGIEEQRVNVVFDIVSPKARWGSLGHGYRVTARVVLWQGDEVLVVPVTSLFRRDGEWSVFVVDEDGKARLRRVTPGHRAALDVEMVDGLASGEVIVANPPGNLNPGDTVAGR